MTEAYDAITSNNQGGAFPNTRAVDSSGPLAADGSEFIKEVLDDVWATKQAELDFYNNSPNGNPNDTGVDVNFAPISQPLAQQYLNYQTPGAVVPIFWNPALDPVILGGTLGFDIRIIILQGQGLDRSPPDFRMLDSLLYVGNAANATADSFFRADNANGTSRNVTGQFLILPDARGQFLRGDDPGALVDPDGASRIPGSKQLDALQDFSGNFEIRDHQGSLNVVFNAEDAFSIAQAGGAAGAAGITSSGAGLPTDQINFNASGDASARTSSESRAVNLSVRWGIYF